MDSPVRVNLPEYNPPPTIEFSNESRKIKSLKLKLSKSVSVQLEITNNNLDLKKSVNKKYLADGSEKVTIWKKYAGLILAIQSSFVFSLTALLVKQFDSHNPISIALWRFQGALWPAIPLFICNQYFQSGGQIPDKPLNPKGCRTASKLKVFALLMTRSILTCNAFLFNFYSLKYLEMGDALAIASSTPVFVTLFAHYFLGEQCGLVPVMTAMLTVFGVIVIARPPHLTGEEGFDLDTLIGTGLALGCMLLGTLSYVTLRYLRKLHYSTVTLAFGAWGTFENLILATLFGVLSFPEGREEWTLAAALVMLTLLGQLSIIFALKKELAGPVALVRTCDVIFAFVWQITFLGKLPDLFSLIGASIIVFGIVLTTLRKWVSSLPPDHISRTRLQFLLM